MSAPSERPAAHATAARAFLAEAAAWVEAGLERALPPVAAGAPRLADAMRYSTLAGGKRLRPALLLAASRALGGSDGDALPCACALEMVHTYSLIHDDLPAMDDDDLRRGRPTCHKAFGEALAILAGDALHTLAFATLLRDTPDAGRARRLGVELASAAGFDGMVGGQVEDLAGDGLEPDQARVERIQAQKTAALIRCATRAGAIAAGADERHVEALGRYGEALGLAFQMVDDVLDETGSAGTLGKTPGKDRRGGKMTWVALEGLDAAQARARREVARALGALDGLPSPGMLVALAHFVTDRDR